MKETVNPKTSGPDRGVIIGLIIGALVLIGILVAGVVLLLQPGTDTARIRDIFIIFMALESLVVGLALVVLIAQIARLINLLQNEIKPIIDSTNETVSTLRGTTRFLSDNLVAPVIKLNEYLAGLNQIIRLVRPRK
ncbi:MAG: hypothetical protein D6803_04180 [Anaerolineae bacterium]|nr:MAG: hypothetical protein D6803_04180 [Anaerolineae bacterium]